MDGAGAKKWMYIKRKDTNVERHGVLFRCSLQKWVGILLG